MLDIWSQGRLVELTADECWETLGSHAVGRIAWCTAGSPQMIPINFAVSEGRLWLRTTAYSRLGSEARERPVAFEVDEIDPFTRSGTSVVVHGMATGLAPLPAELRRTDGLETWVDGTRTLILSIIVQEISGRRLLPS